MTIIFKDFTADAFGEKTTALIGEYLRACREQLPGEDSDLPERIALWHRESASDFRAFHQGFLKNQLSNGSDVRAIVTFCLAFMHSYGQATLDHLYEEMVNQRCVVNPRHIMLGAGLPTLMPLLDATFSAIPRLVHMQYVASWAREYLGTDEYRRCGFEIFGKDVLLDSGSASEERIKQAHIDNIRAARRPRADQGSSQGSDMALYDLFVSIFKGETTQGVSLDQVSAYLIQDILNGKASKDNHLETCVHVTMYPIGLFCHLQGLGVERIIGQLRIVMSAICRALEVDAALGDRVFRGVLINLFYFDAKALRQLRPTLDEVSGHGIGQHVLSGDQHRKLLGGPLALTYHSRRWKPQSLLAFQLECMASAGFDIRFDDVLGGHATAEVQTNLLSREGGCTKGLKAILNATDTLPDLAYESLEEAVNYGALTAHEAAVFISGVCTSVATRYAYWAKHQSWIHAMQPKLPEKTLLQLTPAMRQLTIGCLAQTERLCADAMSLLNVTGEELQATGLHLSEDRWEQALGHDLGL